MNILNILGIKTEKRKLGDIGEDAAAKFLRRAGYKIIERNYVTSDCEVDIICADGKTMAFVEVKTRTLGRMSPMEPRPASAVTKEKQKKIIKAATVYGAYHRKGRRLRLDIVEVLIDDSGGKPKVAEIKHLPGAFDRTDAFSENKYKSN